MGSISMPQGKGSFMHNNRDYDEENFPNNIDKDRTNENIVFRHCESLDKAYKDIFGEALEEYNARQKRADRKIDNYLTRIKNSKNGEHPFYEDVLQWGKKSDFVEHPELREVARDCLLEYISTFEQRNPNLRLIGAYIHMDEASPHLHFDYIPVAEGYKTGLSVRNSLTRALNSMGYGLDASSSKLNNQTVQWKNAERSFFASICQSRGLSVDPEQHNEQREQYSVREYKEIVHAAEEKFEQMVSKADFENRRLMAQNEKLQKEITDKERELDSVEKKVGSQQTISNTLDKIVEVKKVTIEKYSEELCNLAEQKEALEIDVTNLEVQKKDLEDTLSSLSANIDKFFKAVIDAFKKGLSEAREIALKGVEPDTPKKAISKVNEAEKNAITSLDSMHINRDVVKEKIEEKKAETKETVKTEASAERETIQQITRRRGMGR